ncbi:MAG: hypothetical protein ABI972_31090 [Acidobacteriota bacterium]
MIEQAIIAICGVLSVFMSQSPNFDARKWAPIVGLVAQPFWLFASWKAEQYGIFLLSFVYAAGWMRGIRTYWGKQQCT